LYDKVKVFKRIKKLESILFININLETDEELEIRHEKGVLLHYLRALEKLMVDQK
jgi:hypothetical protein|tara:strand:+ start:661 stop:825 length:165 start_codon:yes stop_codon:yes gene_type:complete